MKSIILFFSCCIHFTLSAQSDNTYQNLIAKASLFHLQENYKNAITLYEKAFQIQQPDYLTAYKAAGMYSLDKNADKAFQYLQFSLSSGWTEADWLSFDPYFDYLRNTFPDKWKAIYEQAFVREKKYAQTLELPSLRKEINLLTLNDQKLRYKKVQNINDSLRKVIDEQIHTSDLKNLIKAKEIIRKYGWPTISQIGKDGQNNLWLIVQHADQDVLFQKAVLEDMEKLKGTPELNIENYAFLYDRVQCNLNYKQWYGTQVVWTNNGEASSFRPLIKEYLTDERRKEIGLQPLKIYSLTYGFSYNEINAQESEQKDSIYNAEVQKLMDNAKYFYKKEEFQKTYDYYNTASTFLSGMSNTDNFDAAVLFVKIAAVNSDEKYKSIALDFLDLLFLRGFLTKSQLNDEPAFRILYKEQRWIDLNKKLK
ncbi:tetratricopeptide repeat protein [Chryseobacterium nematophagum]|uniref:Tetratricopeptide repeat protein n=1 Tax=Chryseobacterium nematophagum TaxID=2305228 RepID=A0A3M7LD24_9FLAO|nr:tetratricopeptide repeat protein [Chryseobacterium nematophagum]RMZ59900.1 tetratricopeptide repeat protein [Chryseobacterium nematophagum]